MKKTLRIMSLVLALVICLGMLAGCSSDASSAPASQAGSEAAGVAKTDLVVVMPEDLETFDPVGSSARSTMAITRMIYSTLYYSDEEQQPQPQLATGMEVVSDTQVNFTIVEGATFSDGSPITADDVVASLNRAKASPIFATLMAAVDHFEKVDDLTVAAITTGPAPSIQLALSHVGTSILPAAYIEQAEASGDWSNPVCSGPYVFDSREIGQYVKVVKNEGYYHDETAAQNTSLTFKYVPENSSRTIQVETGEADINYQFTAADMANVEGNDDLKVYQKTGTTVHYFGFDTTQAPFDNPTLRKAVAYAMDRDAIVAMVAEGLGTPAYSLLPPSTLGYAGDTAGYTYDVEKAKELMADAGYPDGLTTRFIVFNAAGQAAAPILQSYCAEIGINLEIEQYESSVRMDMLAAHDVPTFYGSWGAMSDADLVLPRLFTKEAIGGMNFSFWYDDACTELLNSARATYETEERVKLYNEAIEMIDDSACWVPLFIPNSLGLARADLQGVAMDGEGICHLWKLHY